MGTSPEGPPENLMGPARFPISYQEKPPLPSQSSEESMSKLAHESSWNISFYASHSCSYSNELDLHFYVPPYGRKMAFYSPL